MHQCWPSPPDTGPPLPLAWKLLGNHREDGTAEHHHSNEPCLCFLRECCSVLGGRWRLTKLMDATTMALFETFVVLVTLGLGVQVSRRMDKAGYLTNLPITTDGACLPSSVVLSVVLAQYGHSRNLVAESRMAIASHSVDLFACALPVVDPVTIIQEENW